MPSTPSVIQILARTAAPVLWVGLLLYASAPSALEARTADMVSIIQSMLNGQLSIGEDGLTL